MRLGITTSLNKELTNDDCQIRVWIQRQRQSCSVVPFLVLVLRIQQHSWIRFSHPQKLRCPSAAEADSYMQRWVATPKYKVAADSVPLEIPRRVANSLRMFLLSRISCCLQSPCPGRGQEQLWAVLNVERQRGATKGVHDLPHH